MLMPLQGTNCQMSGAQGATMAPCAISGKSSAGSLLFEMAPIILLFCFLLSGCPVNIGVEVETPQLSFEKVIDLSHELYSGIPLFPGGEDFVLENLSDYDKGYYINKFKMGEHTGTHVDAPSHFVKEAKHVNQIDSASLISEGVLINISKKVLANPDYQLTEADITEWEEKNGRIPKESIVLVFTGWQSRWNDKARYLNQDREGILHFPGLFREAAQILSDRKIRGVGIDTLSVDYGPSKDFIIHQILHRNNVYFIENLTNLDQLPAKGFYIVVAPLKIKDGSGAPARVFALILRQQ